MNGIRRLNDLLPLILVGSLLLFLISCQTSTPKPEIVVKIEYGTKGTVPTIQENFNWICADSEEYLLIKR